MWWIIVVQLGVAGSMATIGSLNIQWWAQDRSQRLLGLTGVLCWSVAAALILGAVSLANQVGPVWHVVVPVRALLIGVIVGLFVKTLAASLPRPLPGARAAMVTSVAAPVLFVAFGLTTDLAYVFDSSSPWPVFRPLGNLLVAVTVLLFVSYSAIAIRMLPGASRWQLSGAVAAAVALAGLAAARGPSLESEALTSIWTAPIAILLAWWCSARVLILQGSLLTAEAARQQAELTVQFQARYDQLTGLPNLKAATEALQEMLDNGNPDEFIMAAAVQINGLDEVLAANGVDVADRAVKRFAECLASAGPPRCALARIGESTFLFVVSRPVGRTSRGLEADTLAVVVGVRGAAGLPPELSIATGIAITAGTTTSTTAAELLQQARVALTAAELGGRSIQRYSPELRADLVGRARTVRLLNAAVDRDEFELHYQPVLDGVSGARVSVEALVRWRHHGRLHAPAEWIPIAEQQRLMPAIGVKVLQIAARDYAALGCPIAVNVSPRQFTDPDFAQTVLSALGDCPPTALILEITESSVMTDPARANEALESLRQQGIQIALDDFGTQYSSLSRLSTMPFDVVKIDRSFVHRVLTEEGRAMVTAIHALARALGKITVAEGVETAAQLEAVQDIGCDLVQGFHTGRPVPLAELIAPKANGISGPIGPSANRSLAVRPGLGRPGGRLSEKSIPRKDPTDKQAGFDGRRHTG